MPDEEEDQLRSQRREAVRRVGPFALGMFLAFALVPLAHPHEHSLALALASGLVVALTVVVATAPWRRTTRAAWALPVFAVFPIIALLRYAEGGAASGYAPLITLPLLWLALYGTRRQLVIGLALAGATLGLPPLLIGAPDYPSAEWGRVAAFAFVGPISTLVVHDLVRRVRAQAESLETLRSRLALTEETFRAAFSDAPTAQFMCAPNGALLRINDELCALVEAPRDELFGAETSDLFPGEDADRVQGVLLALWEGRDPGPVEIEARATRSSGAELHVLARMDVVRSDNGRPLFLLGHLVDVTARVVAAREEALRADGARAVKEAIRGLGDSADARARLTEAAGEVTDAQAVVLMEADGSGSLIATASSARARRPADIQIGRRQSHAATALASHERILAAADDPAGVSAMAGVPDAGCVLFEPILYDDVAVGVLVVAWACARDEVSDEALIAAHLLAGETAAVLARSDRLARLTRLAQEDPLTKLPNRRVWEDQLPREMARAARERGPLCVAIVDLDHFKAYNDTKGHAAGDKLLLHAAAEWTERLRRSDVLARYGGEEFAVMLPGCAIDRALPLLERLREATPGEVTCSVGLAEWDGIERPDQLIERADRALYVAKREGRDRTTVSAGSPPHISAA